MKKWISILLAAALISCPLAANAAELPITDASKWSPSFTGEREYKTPDQSVKKVNDGIEFTGIGGERENFTYGFSEPLNFPKEDLTIEFTLKEGTEDEMMMAFAFTDKPNWGSWYSSNDTSGMIFTVRPNDVTNFHMAPALDWPTEVMLNWPARDDANPPAANAVKDKKMKFEFKHTGTSMKLIVNGYEITDFEEKFSEFYLDSTLPDGKCYLTVSGLNYTFDPELRSTLVLHSVTTTPASSGTTTSSEGAAAASSGSTGGPVIDGGDEEESEPAGTESTASTGSTASSSDDGNGSSLLWLWIVVAVVVVAGAGVAVFFVVKNKKSSSGGNKPE